MGRIEPALYQTDLAFVAKPREPDSQEIPTGFNLLYPVQVEQLKSQQNRADFIAIVWDQLGSEDAARARMSSATWITTLRSR